MGTRLSAAGPAVFLISGLMFSAATAADTHKLARSSELGVEIDAMGGEGWCRQRLALTVHAQDAGVYPSADFAELIKKLGQVLKAECPEAHRADLNGLDASGALVYEGNASSSSGWLVTAKLEPPRTAQPAAPICLSLSGVHLGMRTGEVEAALNINLSSENMIKSFPWVHYTGNTRYWIDYYLRPEQVTRLKRYWGMADELDSRLQNSALLATLARRHISFINTPVLFTYETNNASDPTRSFPEVNITAGGNLHSMRMTRILNGLFSTTQIVERLNQQNPGSVIGRNIHSNHLFCAEKGRSDKIVVETTRSPEQKTTTIEFFLTHEIPTQRPREDQRDALLMTEEYGPSLQAAFEKHHGETDIILDTLNREVQTLENSLPDL